MPLNSVTEQFCRQQRAADPNVSPKELAQALAAEPRYAKRIYADDLNGLFGRQPQIKLKIKDAVRNFPRNEQTLLLIAGLDLLIDTAALGGQNGWLATDEPEIAAQMRFFAPAVAQAGVLIGTEVDALIGLAGGDYYEHPTPEEIAALFAADDIDTARKASVDNCVSALNAVKALINSSDPVPDRATLVKTFEAALA